jgi:predicted negative regulator of RcsB-dependent stress response
MATALDLQDQEQIDELKAFWRKYGTLITWALALGLAVLAAFNGWQWWQRKQADGAAVMFDQLQNAAKSKDPVRAAALFNDLQARFASTTYAANGGLLTATTQAAQNLPDEALKSLAWVSSNATDPDVKTMARMNAAGLLLDKKQFDEALKQLDASGKPAGTLGALLADRRGDVLAAMGKGDEARVAYELAYQTMDEKLDYRLLIDAKLAAMGASPKAAASAAAAAAPAKAASPASGSGQ